MENLWFSHIALLPWPGTRGSAMRLRQAVIPAAGLGTRFLPATKAIPKELLTIVDKPIIQYIVEEAVASGITRIVLVLSRGKEAIQEHFSRAPELERYLKDKGRVSLLETIRRVCSLVDVISVRQERPLGLGHAVLCAKRVVGNEPFAVLLGDDMVDSSVPCLLQMRRVFEAHRASVIALHKVKREEVQRYGIIEGTKVGRNLYKIHGLVEKPSPEKAPSRLAIIGRYILFPEIFDILEKARPGHGGEIQLTDALQRYLTEGQLYGYIFHGDRYDAGDRRDFLKANLAFAWKRTELRRDLRDFVRLLIKRGRQKH